MPMMPRRRRQRTSRRRRAQDADAATVEAVADDDDSSSSSSSSSPLPPDYFDQLRLNATDVERVNNLDVIRNAGPTVDGDSEHEHSERHHHSELAFCHLAALVPISFVSDDGVRTPYARGRDIGGMAGVLLALRHLNEGDGTVVPELAGLNETCRVRFTAEVFDTERSEYTTVNNVLNLLRRTPGVERLPCAFLGASRSAVSMPSSIITGLYDYPQVSHYSTSSALDDKNQYKLFGRVIPSDDATSIPAIRYLRRRLNVRYLGVIHGNDAYGIAYSRSLQNAAAAMHLSSGEEQMIITPVEIPYSNPKPHEIANAVRLLSLTQFRYFVAVVNGAVVYKDLMEEAYNQGIAGDGYTWIFSDSLNHSFITGLELERDSPLERATRGISVLSAEGGLPGMPVYDRFVRAYGNLSNPHDVRYVESKIPSYDDDPTYISPNVTELMREAAESDDPGTSAALLYDATVALGLSACAAGSNGTAFDGTEHYRALVESDFVGASGHIVFDPMTGSRDPNSAIFQLTNFVPNTNTKATKGINGDDNKVTFSAVRSDLFRDGEWERVSPYVFADGTTSAHGDLPDITIDHMYNGTALRAAGLCLSAIVLSLSVGFSLWTYRERNGKVVKSSQPIFLHFIALGTFIMGSSIIPLSFDDEVASDRGCSVACMAFPWLLSIGFSLAVGALFSKTWRLNKIFYNPEMRRIQVTTRDAVRPMVTVVVLNVIVLSVWTAVSPWGWRRSVTSVDAFNRTVESQGYCMSEGTSLPYIVTLAVLNGSALIKALHQVYRARRISNEFGETRYIALAMSGVLLVAMIGVPVMIIARENPRANFFVLSALIFVVCTLLLLFIFVPKIRFHKKIVAGDMSMRHVVSEFSRQSAEIGKRQSAAAAEGRKSTLSNVSNIAERGRSILRSSVESIALPPRSSFARQSSGSNIERTSSTESVTLPPLSNEEENECDEVVVPQAPEEDGPQVKRGSTVSFASGC